MGDRCKKLVNLPFTKTPRVVYIRRELTPETYRCCNLYDLLWRPKTKNIRPGRTELVNIEPNRVGYNNICSK
jgi:hypothetical protein